MATAMPRLHFAMLTYGALGATQRAVKSLAANTPPGFQLHIIDNASTDATPEWLQQQRQPWLRHRLNPTNRGVAGGRNDLLEFIQPTAADHDWIVFIDNDLEFQTDWVVPFLRAIQQFPDARVLGKIGHFVTVTDNGRNLQPAAAHTAEVDVVSGGFACFVRVDAARAIGKFDEQLGRFWHEDDDYCVRALQHGHQVVAVPEAQIVHHEHASGIATPDLPTGGSPENLSFLASKWRQAGWVDSGGWIKRTSGPYMVPAVRTALEQKSGRATAIGRTELAASITLLEQMFEQRDALAWFDENRRPIPACTWPLLAMHREHATTTGDTKLGQDLANIEAVLKQAANTTLLKPMLRGPIMHRVGSTDTDARGQGVCRNEDFDSEEFMALANELGVSGITCDPNARTAALWEMLAVANHLRREGLDRAGRRVLSMGDDLNRIGQWLTDHRVEFVQGSTAKPPQGHYDAIIFSNTTDIDVLQTVVAKHATAATTVIIVGCCSLNGVPMTGAPQPHQIALDLMARIGLTPTHNLRLRTDDGALEACQETIDTEQTPILCWLNGPQLCTRFAVAARRTPVAAKPGTLLTPTRPSAEATLRVGVDLRTLQHADSTSRGIGKFTTQHLGALCDLDPGLRIVGYTQSEKCSLPPAMQRAEVTTMPIDDYSPEQVDLVHIPDPMNMSFGFDSPTRVLRHEHTTATFHDLTPLHLYLDQWPRCNREAYLDRLHQLERGECHLLSNSQFTKADTLAHTKIPKERITPILAGLHHDGGQPPSNEQIAEVHQQLNIRGPFVLHVGALDPHKNFYSALNAFLMARSQHPLQLVVVGAIDPGMTQAAAFCSKQNVPDVLFTGYLPRKHLDALYASATALLFLSRAEGFGLPIL